MPKILSCLRQLAGKSPVTTLSSVDAYARWSKEYPAHAHNALMQTEQQAMLQLMPDLTGQVVLDLACGTGRYARLALEHGAEYVIGFDNSFAMLLAGINSNTNSPLNFLQAAIDHIPMRSETVDIVLCGMAVGHLPDINPIFHEIARVLKPGGAALISDFHPYLFLTGRKRTFNVDGKTYAVEHYVHLYSDIHHAAGQAALKIETLIEPEMEIDGARLPAVMVYRLLK